MFENDPTNFNFTCDYQIKYEGDIVFGQQCVTSVQSYVQSLVTELNIQNAVELPSCDSVCEQLGAKQVNYDEFISISLETLQSFCDDPQVNSFTYCKFNVTVDYDYEKQVWRKKDGTVIDDLLWSSNTFPKYKDLLTLRMSLTSHSNPVYWVETSPRRPRKVRESLSTGYMEVIDDNRAGYYFCAEDPIIDEMLKLGTFTEARNQCPEIFTPQVCQDPTLTDRLLNLARNRTIEPWRSVYANYTIPIR